MDHSSYGLELLGTYGPHTLLLHNYVPDMQSV